MAWRAFLAEPVTAQGTDGLRVVIKYYDDADPANAGVGPGPPVVHPAPEKVLHSRIFMWPAARPRAELQIAIQREGAEARSIASQAETMNGQFAVGTTLAIP